MKVQLIRALGMVVSAAILGGCIVSAAMINRQPRYEFFPMSRSQAGITSQVLARGDRITGETELTVSSGFKSAATD